METKPFRPEVSKAVATLLKEAEKDKLGIAVWIENEETESLSLGVNKDHVDSTSISLLAILAMMYDIQQEVNEEGIATIIQTVVENTNNPITRVMARKILKMQGGGVVEETEGAFLDSLLDGD